MSRSDENRSRESSLNRKLLVAAGILLLLSGFTHFRDLNQAERFERGQKLLANLNADEIGDVMVAKGDSRVTLKRDVGTVIGRDQYTLSEQNGYAAKNEAINRLVNSLLDLQLEKEVGSGAALAEELGLEPVNEESVDVQVFNSDGAPMVHLRVGDRAEEGGGRYVMRLDLEESPIYLTQGSPNLETSADSFLRKEVVDVPSAEVVRVEGPDFLIAKGEEDGSVSLQDLSGGQTEAVSQVGEVRGAFSRLEFDTVFLADDPEVVDLPWRRAYRALLEDQSGYAVMYAVKDERHFLRISSFLEVDRIEITQEETDEELKEKSSILKRNEEVQAFNGYHGSWVYEVTESVGSKFAFRKADLVD